MTGPRALPLALAVVVLLTAGCSAPLAPDDDAGQEPTPSGASAPPTDSPSDSPTGSPTEGRPPTATSTPAPTKTSRTPDARSTTHVIAISVDGLNPTALTQLGDDVIPNYKALIRGGAGTLNARTELELTETLPNHTGMLTGRPVEGPDGHGVDFNEDREGVTIDSHAGHPVPSVFDVVHDAGRSTALYAAKEKFHLFQRSWADSLDRSVIDTDNERLVTRLTTDLASTPATFTFVHLSAPDLAGHDSGFMGPAYLRAVISTDLMIGSIREAVDDNPALRDRTTLIVTADHGGRGNQGHADPAKLDDYRVPFLVEGPDVRRGGDLYRLNRDYRDPGTGRPSYAGAQPVRNGDVADLSTRLLGLRPVPGSSFGARRTLDVG